jgi:hypothetical protein
LILIPFFDLLHSFSSSRSTFGFDASYVAGAREAGLSAYQVGGAAGVRAGLAAHGLERR